MWFLGYANGQTDKQTYSSQYFAHFPHAREPPPFKRDGRAVKSASYHLSVQMKHSSHADSDMVIENLIYGFVTVYKINGTLSNSLTLKDYNIIHLQESCAIAKLTARCTRHFFPPHL